MRVNVDSSILTDPRTEKMWQQLDTDLPGVLGSLILVWMACYHRRAAIMPADEIDIAAKRAGMADVMVTNKLATRLRSGRVRVHGVKARISFLAEQSAKGAKGGNSTAKKRRSKQANAAAEAAAKAAAYTPTPAPAPTPDLSKDPRAPARGNGADKSGFAIEADKHAAVIAWTEVTSAIANGKALDGKSIDDEHAVAVVKKMGAVRLRNTKADYLAAARKEFLQLYAALGES